MIAPLEFTKVVKEVQVIALARGIRIHQYPDDWLLRPLCHEACQQHTHTPGLPLCYDLGWVVNLNKLQPIPQQVFNFVYHFDQSQDLVRPT